MLEKIALSLIFLGAPLALAESQPSMEGWGTINDVGTIRHDVKMISIHFLDAQSDDIAVAVDGRLVEKSSGNIISYVEYYVKASECGNRRGSLYLRDSQGVSTVIYPFLLGEKDIASTFAAALCEFPFKQGKVPA